MKTRKKTTYERANEFEVAFIIQANESIEPDKFTLTEPQLKVKEYKTMPYLHTLGFQTDGYVEKIMNSYTMNRMNVDNPLFGYKIKGIKSSSRRSEILIVKNYAYMKYAGYGSPYNELSEKSLKESVE